MSDYKLTNKGKIVLSLFILTLVAIIVTSGNYIVTYFNSRISDVAQHTTNEMTTEPIDIETTTEPVPSFTEPIPSLTESIPSLTEPDDETKDEDRIYSVLELDDLKQFKIMIYFDELSDIVQISDSDLESIKSMIHFYPNEKIAIAGHVNGYPNFNFDEGSYHLSINRASFIKNILLELGVEESLIKLYNYGSEKPIYKDYGNQNKNNRVEIYFEDHFVNGDGGK